MTYTITQEKYEIFLANYKEPERLSRYPDLSAISHVSMKDINRMISVVTLPFTTTEITIENNSITFIKVNK